MSEEKLVPELEQVKIKQTSPIRFRDEAINKIRKQNFNFEKKRDFFIQFELDQFSENVQKDLVISETNSFYQEISNLLRDSNWWSTATVTDACKYYLNCARNNISYFKNYVEADSDLSQDQKNEIFALYQLCTLFVSWNAIKDKKIREIIDIRKSLFFR